MQASTLVAQHVEYIGYKTVTDCGSDLGQRPLAIDAHDRSCEHAIGIGSDPCDIEIICDGGSMNMHAQAEKDDAGKGNHGESDENVPAVKADLNRLQDLLYRLRAKDTFRGPQESQYGTALMDVLLSGDLIR